METLYDKYSKIFYLIYLLSKENKINIEARRKLKRRIIRNGYKRGKRNDENNG